MLCVRNMISSRVLHGFVRIIPGRVRVGFVFSLNGR